MYELPPVVQVAPRHMWRPVSELLLEQRERQPVSLGVEVVHSSEVAAVVLYPAEGGAAQLAGGVDPVYGLVLGQAPLVAELLAAGVAGEDVLKGAEHHRVLPTPNLFGTLTLCT